MDSKVMTGRELILYILMNDLEDAPVFEDGKFIGFMTEGEAAEKFDVGVATIRVWINQDKMYGIKIGSTVYVPMNAKDPRELGGHSNV